MDSSGGDYDCIDEAIAAAKQVVVSARCACIFGKCSRNQSDPGSRDWYEPAEDFLRKADLPWFYFVASKTNLAREFWEEYERETHILWGDDADND